MNENATREGAGSELDAEARREDRRFGERGFGVGGLPFQFQIPLGGGPPGLALPLGGVGSPLAFTVPLGGSAPTAVPAAPVTATAPAAPAQPSTPPSDAPVVLPSDAPAYAPPTEMGETELMAERVVAAAEAFGRAGNGSRSSSLFLESLFSAGLGNRLDGGGAAPSATALFRAIVYPQAGPRRSASRYVDGFQVVARPGDRLAGISPRRGDLLIRVARGQGWGLIAVVGSPGLHRHDRLSSLGLRFEGYPRLEPGAYVHLVEPGPRFRGLDMRFARRLCDRIGCVLPDTLLLRLRPLADWAEAAPAEPDPGAAQGAPVLRAGHTGAAVRRAQAQLNRIHADLVALHLGGLPGCPLPEDGRFSDRMATAVLALQQQIFADPAQWDGTIGPATKSQLDLLAGTATPSADAVEADGGRQQVATTRCPPDRPEVVRGFKRYSNAINLLPADQRIKLIAIARQITDSQAGPTAVTQVLLTGHADVDPERERREPGFIQRMSQQRAEAVRLDLQDRVGAPLASQITWTTTGQGAMTLAVPNPRTEVERECNRRVEITLVSDRGYPGYPFSL